MKPLLFLATRTFLNGIKRALTSPRRLISLLLFLGYYFFIFMRPFEGRRPGFGRMPENIPQWDFNQAQSILGAAAFSIFALVSLFMLVSVLSYQSNYKPADVDVLFPTPLSPKLVLAFRMARDYLITLLVPLVLLLFVYKPTQIGLEQFFKNIPNPEMARQWMRAMGLSWVLLSLSWVALSYALSMYVNRSDAGSERRRKFLAWGLAAIAVAMVSYIYAEATKIASWQDFVALTELPLIRVFFFNASFASSLALAPIFNSLPMALFGGGSLIALIALGIWLSMLQVGWMYDEAATKSNTVRQMRSLAQSGDMVGMMAERARQGKLKAGKRGKLHRLRMQGPMALIWKEMLIQPRGMMGLLILLTLSGVTMTVLPALLPSGKNDAPAGIILLAMQGFTVFSITMALAQAGFIEVLRRVDLQKPLPFTPSVIVFVEILAKSALPIIASAVGALVVLVIKPELWVYVVSALIFTPFLAVLLSSCVFFVTMLFPDLDDPSQRQFRGLMTMLAFAVCGFFPVVGFSILAALGAPLPVAALAGSALALGISFVLALVSGRLYATFNPSE